MNTRYHNLLRK